MQQATLPTKFVEPELPEGLRFSIRSLLVLTVVCALTIVLIDQLWIVGTIILFVASAVASLVLRRPEYRAQRRFWLQGIWGILMPLACLVTDPMFFLTSGVKPEAPFEAFNDPSNFRPYAAASYAFILWQMTMLVASWFATKHQAMWSAWLAGNLYAGALFAGGIGVCMLPMAAIASIMLVGLPGFTPLITAVVFFRTAGQVWQPIRENGAEPRHQLVLILGLVVSASLWLGIHALWMSLGISGAGGRPGWLFAVS